MTGQTVFFFAIIFLGVVLWRLGKAREEYEASQKPRVIIGISGAPNESGGTGLPFLRFLNGNYLRTDRKFNGAPIYEGVMSAQRPWNNWNTCGRILGTPKNLSRAVKEEWPVVVFRSSGGSWRIGWEVSEDVCRTYGEISPAEKSDGSSTGWSVTLGANSTTGRTRTPMFSRYRGGPWLCEECTVEFVDV